MSTAKGDRPFDYVLLLLLGLSISINFWQWSRTAAVANAAAEAPSIGVGASAPAAKGTLWDGRAVSPMPPPGGSLTLSCTRRIASRAAGPAASSGGTPL